MKKKFLATMLSMCMLLSLIPSSAFALSTPSEQPEAVVTANSTATEVNDIEGLKAAVAKSGEVKLAADFTANLIIPKDVTVTLDLNGHTLSGGTDKIDGQDSEHKDKPAILNHGTLIIKDSVGTGMVKRDDVNVSGDSYYVIDNQGTLTIESGKIFNNSGVLVDGKNSGGSSLIRNGGISKGNTPGYAKLYIKGGILEQDNFIAVKNDELSVFEMTGGTINCKNESAIQNWANATISGGTINGLIWTLAYDAAGSSKTTLSGNVAVNGKIWAENYSAKGTEKADIEITGGTYTLGVEESKPGPELRAQDGGSIAISGGSFNVDPTAYMADNFGMKLEGGKYVVSSLDATNAAAQIGSDIYATLEKAVAAAQDGDIIKVLKDVTLGSTMSVEKKLTIDGQAHTITGHIVNKSELALNHVTITSADGKAPTISNEDGTLNIDAASIVENTGDHYAIKTKGGAVVSSGIIRATFGKGNHGISANGTNITINDGLVKGSDAGVSAGIALFNRNYANDNQGNAPSVCVINGGKIQGKAYAITGNNQKSGGDPGCSLTVNKGELVADSAIYWPNNGTVVIGTAGGSDADVKITGTDGTGIEVICGNLTINSGTISGTASQTVTDDTLLANYAKYSGCGGCGDALTIVKNRAKAYAANPLSVTVNGGTFLSANGNYSLRMFDCANKQPAGTEASGQTFGISVTGGKFPDNIECSRSNETKFISGGYFTSDPSAYVIDGKAAVKSDKDGYNFMIDKKPDLAAEVASAPAEIPANNLPSDATDADKALADQMHDAMAKPDKDKALTVTGDGLDLAARDKANHNTVTTDTGAEALKKLPGQGDASSKNTKIVVQHFVEVQVTDAKAPADGSKTITVEVTPKAQTVAVKDTVLNSDIKVGKNAVKINDPVELTVNDPVTVTIPLPDNFAADGKINIRHDKNGRHYVYEGTVKSNVLTFVSEHGLSPFTIGVAAPAAKIGTVGYVTLADAVDAVKDNETIVLNDTNNETSTVSRTVKFTLDKNGNDFTGSIKAGDHTTLTVSKDEKGNSVYTFTYVGGSSSGGNSKPVKPGECDGGINCPTHHLLDVDKNAWYHTSVDYAVKNGLMTGTSAFTFDPELTTSRSMIVTMLYNLEKRPTVTAANPFKDVENGVWYTDAIRWAAANGIVAGYDSTTFGPNDAVTREQMAVILYHYAAYKGYNMSASANLSRFSDADQISGWALTAMQWANANRLINGTNTATILPQLTADRAQTACMLHNFCENLTK